MPCPESLELNRFNKQIHEGRISQDVCRREHVYQSAIYSQGQVAALIRSLHAGPFQTVYENIHHSLQNMPALLPVKEKSFRLLIAR